MKVSAVIPVKDGERYLEELLAALERERVDEVLVIDSGSSDHSVAVALAAGVEVLEIPPAEFGHGRTRNLGAERTSGELICFLTQDATPVEGWLEAYRAAFALDSRVGAAYGPHLPREDTSPMIARELTQFFAGFSPNGAPVVQRPGDEAFLSNVNACYRRPCWEEIRFRDVPYSEDQAFGRDLLAADWLKVYHPGAAVLHAHDYGVVGFMRRYFDEYRGLRETVGHVEPFRARTVARDVVAMTRADLRWMRSQGVGPAARSRWAGRAAAHHAGRRVASALGSRAERLPERVQGALSLERRGGGSGGAGGAAGSPLPAPVHMGPRRREAEYGIAARVLHGGPVPLLDAVPGLAERDRLHVAVIIPPFSRGSGGHNTIFQIVSRLERMGHTCSVWLEDQYNQAESVWPAVLRREINEYFAPIAAPVYKDFSQWYGADVVLATGWQTVYPALLLDQCRARAYLVNDHESEFYATSVEGRLAELTYSYDLFCIAASPWLRDLLTDRYGLTATAFDLGVDHAVYRPRPVERRRDTVVYYSRAVTPRRAVPLGLQALDELRRRRPDVRIILYGDPAPPATSFAYESVGILSPEQLSWLYSEATVGLSLSMTNFSLIPKEMLACGLPCVELAGISAESIFGTDGPIELAPFDPIAIADGIERLLDSPTLWERRSTAGIEFVHDHTWDAAAGQVERALREALTLRAAQAV